MVNSLSLCLCAFSFSPLSPILTPLLSSSGDVVNFCVPFLSASLSPLFLLITCCLIRYIPPLCLGEILSSPLWQWRERGKIPKNSSREMRGRMFFTNFFPGVWVSHSPFSFVKYATCCAPCILLPSSYGKERRGKKGLISSNGEERRRWGKKEEESLEAKKKRGERWWWGKVAV